MYDLPDIRNDVLQEPEIRLRNLTDRERAKKVAHRLSEEILEDMGELV
jgi:hypothetical protein